MLILNTEKFLVILALLSFALATMVECKRGGGGGRIFRATVLKERRNSRRPRDLHAQAVVEPDSNALLDEIFETPLKATYGQTEEAKDYIFKENAPNEWYTNAYEHNDDYSNDKYKASKSNDEENYSLEENYSTEEVRKLQQYGLDSEREKLKNDYQKNIEEDTEYQNSGVSDNVLFEKGRRGKFNAAISKSYNELKKHKKLVMSVLDVILGFMHRSHFSPHNKSKKILKQIIVPIDSIVPCKKSAAFFCPSIATPLCTNNNEILCIVHKKQDAQCNEASDVMDEEAKIEENVICVVALMTSRFNRDST